MVKSPGALPPKLSRPSAAGVAARERLFALLDRFRRPITWIDGPPGAGKTSLVSSWIEARGARCLWYQVDASDADPATLFHNVRQAVPADAEPLPPLTPEYLPDLNGFTRRFFRALVERMPDLAVIVFDNFQDAPEDSPFPLLVREIAEVEAVRDSLRDGLPCMLSVKGEKPGFEQQTADTLRVVVLSRSRPPAAFARAIAYADLARLDWEDLRLDLEETRRLAGLEGVAEEARARRLLERTGGWAAGVRLLRDTDPNTAAEPDPAAAPEAPFDYLATRVFDQSAPETQDLWLATAYLPRFTPAMAEALTGRNDAGNRLEALAGQRYFIDRCAGSESAYQYHALFAEFLHRQLERERDAAARRALAHRSAALLDAAGDAESAFRLYCEVADFQAAAPLILREAPALLAQGRFQSLERALAGLPADLFEASPWLGYWLGVARSMASPDRGRAELERAYRAFAGCGDLTGEALAIAAIMDSYFAEWHFLPPLDPWIEAAERVIERGPVFPSPDAGLRFWGGVLSALQARRPGHRLGAVAAERIQQLAAHTPSVSERTFAAVKLIQWASALGDTAAAERAIESTQSLLDGPGATPLARALWRLALGVYSEGRADFARFVRLADETVAIARENGFVFLEPAARLFAVWARLGQGDVDGAAAHLRAAEPIAVGSNPSDVALLRFLHGWIARAQGRHRDALAFSGEAAARSAEVGGIGPCVFSYSLLALSRLDTGDASGAMEAIRETHRWTRGLDRGVHVMLPALVEARILLGSGRRDEALEPLRRAFAAGRLSALASTGMWLPDLAAVCSAAALAAGVETAYVTHLARQRALPSPAPELEHWPWPIKIRAFGSFEVVVDGEVLQFARKAQRRVLDLLKCVVALGADGVSRATVAAALWPDAEGDAASQSFDVTLHRLRKLIGRDDAVQLSHGLLHLDPTVVWVDATAFERLADRANGAHDDLDPEAAARALALYRGPLLAKEDEAPWLIPARERLRSRYLRLARRLAQRAEASGDLAHAVEVCRTALEVEPLAEDLHRRLMLALAAQGRRAEALDAYRRCRHVLEAVLGAAPSSETETIRAAIARAA